MITHQQEERVAARERARTPRRVSIAERFGLLNELQPSAMRAGGGTVSPGVSGMNHHADILGAGVERLLDDDGERGLGSAVAIHKGLQRQRALIGTGGG